MSVEREISLSIEKDFFKGKVIVILGARQVGKRYSIRDFSGRTIRDGKISSTQEQIDLQNVARGAYYLSIENSTSVTKLIKQ